MGWLLLYRLGMGTLRLACQATKIPRQGQRQGQVEEEQGRWRLPDLRGHEAPYQIQCLGQGDFLQQQPASTGQGGLAKHVQRAVNNPRRSETRLRKLGEEEEAAKAKWEEFQLQLKTSFIKERTRT